MKKKPIVIHGPQKVSNFQNSIQTLKSPQHFDSVQQLCTSQDSSVSQPQIKPQASLKATPLPRQALRQVESSSVLGLPNGKVPSRNNMGRTGMTSYGSKARTFKKVNRTLNNFGMAASRNSKLGEGSFHTHNAHLSGVGQLQKVTSTQKLNAVLSIKSYAQSRLGAPMVRDASQQKDSTSSSAPRSESRVFERVESQLLEKSQSQEPSKAVVEVQQLVANPEMSTRNLNSYQSAQVMIPQKQLSRQKSSGVCKEYGDPQPLKEQPVLDEQFETLIQMSSTTPQHFPHLPNLNPESHPGRKIVSGQVSGLIRSTKNKKNTGEQTTEAQQQSARLLISSTESRPLLRLETEPPERISTYGALDIDIVDPHLALGIEKSPSVEIFPKRALPVKEFKGPDVLSMKNLSQNGGNPRPIKQNSNPMLRQRSLQNYPHTGPKYARDQSHSSGPAQHMSSKSRGQLSEINLQGIEKPLPEQTASRQSLVMWLKHDKIMRRSQYMRFQKKLNELKFNRSQEKRPQSDKAEVSPPEHQEKPEPPLQKEKQKVVHYIDVNNQCLQVVQKKRVSTAKIMHTQINTRRSFTKNPKSVGGFLTHLPETKRGGLKPVSSAHRFETSEQLYGHEETKQSRPSSHQNLPRYQPQNLKFDSRQSPYHEHPFYFQRRTGSSSSSDRADLRKLKARRPLSTMTRKPKAHPPRAPHGTICEIPDHLRDIINVQVLQPQAQQTLDAHIRQLYLQEQLILEEIMRESLVEMMKERIALETELRESGQALMLYQSAPTNPVPTRIIPISKKSHKKANESNVDITEASIIRNPINIKASSRLTPNTVQSNSGVKDSRIKSTRARPTAKKGDDSDEEEQLSPCKTLLLKNENNEANEPEKEIKIQIQQLSQKENLVDEAENPLDQLDEELLELSAQISIKSFDNQGSLNINKNGVKRQDSQESAFQLNPKQETSVHAPYDTSTQSAGLVDKIFQEEMDANQTLPVPSSTHERQAYSNILAMQIESGNYQQRVKGNYSIFHKRDYGQSPRQDNSDIDFIEVQRANLLNTSSSAKGTERESLHYFVPSPVRKAHATIGPEPASHHPSAKCVKVTEFKLNVGMKTAVTPKQNRISSLIQNRTMVQSEAGDRVVSQISSSKKNNLAIISSAFNKHVKQKMKLKRSQERQPSPSQQLLGKVSGHPSTKKLHLLPPEAVRSELQPLQHPMISPMEDPDRPKLSDLRESPAVQSSVQERPNVGLRWHKKKQQQNHEESNPLPKVKKGRVKTGSRPLHRFILNSKHQTASNAHQEYIDSLIKPKALLDSIKQRSEEPSGKAGQKAEFYRNPMVPNRSDSRFTLVNKLGEISAGKLVFVAGKEEKNGLRVPLKRQTTNSPKRLRKDPSGVMPLKNIKILSNELLERKAFLHQERNLTLKIPQHRQSKEQTNQTLTLD